MNPKRRSLLKQSLRTMSSLGVLTLLLTECELVQANKGVKLIGVRIWPSEDYTRITLESDQALPISHQLLAGPDRLVVDIDSLELNPTLKELVAKVKPNDPYVAQIRVGQFQPNVVRLVFDLKEPIKPQLFTLEPVAEYKFRSVFDLYPTTPPDPLMQLVRSSAKKEQALEKKNEEDLIAQGIVGISGVDTRALTRHLRDRGAMKVGIFSDTELTPEEMVIQVRASGAMAGAYLAADVSTATTYVVPAVGTKKFTVAALDLGIKAATPRSMAARGIEVHVMPFNSTFDEISALNPDGVFISNGPGDPSTMNETVELVREVLNAKIPIFGICFGHQILGRALGFESYKLQFGHRGINQPVIDKVTEKVEITAHNHGFAIKAPTSGTFATVFGPGQVTHVNLNDDVVEGLALLEQPAFSVQYHPEAAAGPHDANYLFDRFVELMTNNPVGVLNA